MAYLADWVVETAFNPGSSTVVELTGAAPGPFVTFASAFSTGNRVFYTISDEQAQRETGIGTFTAGSPNTISRDTVTANTLGTTARVNFTGSVFIYCMTPASQAVYADVNGSVAKTGTEWTITQQVNGNVNAIILSQASPAPFPSSGLVINIAAATSTYALFQVANVLKGSITTNGTNVFFNATSDANLKIDDGEFVDGEAGRIIDKLMPRWFRWKATPDGNSEPGFFAQQVHRCFPWAVTKGRGRSGAKDHMPWQMDPAKLVVLAIAEIKSLRRRIAELEKAR